ncbi:MAG: endolytic transglycosylase MltG [Candidatus Adiutrix sp.]|jgi:UPF0755 protein|nr:endolytic transglycosylase MltG [Candidatus Adiutrix sp.]
MTKKSDRDLDELVEPAGFPKEGEDPGLDGEAGLDMAEAAAVLAESEEDYRERAALAEDDGPRVRTGPGCLMRLFGLFGIAVCVGFILAFLGALKYSVLFLPASEESREVVVSIPDGAPPARIGDILEQAGVIKSGSAFVWTLRAKNRLGRSPVVLKAGEMALDPSHSVWRIIDSLAKGSYKLYPFTVPEGRNIYDLAQMVEAQGFGSASDFLELCRDKSFIRSLGLNEDSLEGYLFPETYNFPKGTTLKGIIKEMTSVFHKVWRKYETLALEKGLSAHEVVTLASIVEKETGQARERPLIAGVFFNRLARGMKLQTDPTVIYGLLPGFNGNLTEKDLARPTPYNTYVISGLPPGPIANPGEAAIQAVIRPDILQPYLYFVSRNDGSHHFSKTLEEHNRMVNRYQRAGRSRAR